MKIALISMRPKITEKKNNLQIMESYISSTKADLFVFGEISLTGYRCKDELRELAEPMNGPSIEMMKNVAIDNKCHIIFGMPMKNNTVKGLIYNSAVLIHPTGNVDIYNKWFLPTFGPFEEKLFFDHGERLTVFQTSFGRVGLLICYDIFFPEICKAYSLQGADVLICISASPQTTRPFFETMIPARAIENTTFFAYVNLVGTQEDLVCWGGSQLYDPTGKLLIKAPYFEESIVTCTIDFHMLDLARANRPVLRDTRPEIYQDLYMFARHHMKKKPK